MLGHARLSIIDLSSVASQPMSNECGDVWVVFNGEIYNHAELRRNFVALGHRFRTDHSDTEVLVHGYEEWGETLVERLRGMFAFATLSLRDRTLFLARDRFGEKPLYLAMGFRGVCFASELKALLAGGFVEREISPQALGDYLVHGFIPAPRSIFKGVIKLAAAQCVTIDIEHPDNYRPRTYWRPSTYLDTAIPAEQAIEEFNHELNRSILMRMQSDVPLGAFLSGGLDSTTVVKHMASAGGPVNTFTIGFRDAKYDEARYARMAANCYRTRHLVQILQPDDMLRVLPIIERHYDEPFADSSAIPTYLVSRMARRDRHGRVVGRWRRRVALRLSLLPNSPSNGEDFGSSAGSGHRPALKVGSAAVSKGHTGVWTHQPAGFERPRETFEALVGRLIHQQRTRRPIARNR